MPPNASPQACDVQSCGPIPWDCGLGGGLGDRTTSPRLPLGKCLHFTIAALTACE